MLIPAHAQAADALPDHYKELYFDAARAGRVDLLEGMIKDGVPVDLRDSHGYTALILAAYDEQPAAVDLLLAKHADPCAADLKGNTALMGVAFKGELAIAQKLVGLCDVNTRNREGQTAAMMAALFGHADIVRLLAAARRRPAAEGCVRKQRRKPRPPAGQYGHARPARRAGIGCARRRKPAALNGRR